MLAETIKKMWSITAHQRSISALALGTAAAHLVSMGITFAQFSVIIVWNLIKPCLSAGWRCRRDQGHDVIDYDDIAHERIEDPELEPLISDTPRPITMSASAKYTK